MRKWHSTVTVYNKCRPVWMETGLRQWRWTGLTCLCPTRKAATLTRLTAPRPTFTDNQPWLGLTRALTADKKSLRKASSITTKFPIWVPCSTNTPTERKTEWISHLELATITRWEICHAICSLAMSVNGVEARLSPICTPKSKSVATLSFRTGAVSFPSLHTQMIPMKIFLIRRHWQERKMKKSKKSSTTSHF